MLTLYSFVTVGDMRHCLSPKRTQLLSHPKAPGGSTISSRAPECTLREPYMAPAHPGSPPPRKRMMLAGQVQQGGNGPLGEAVAAAMRQQSVLEVMGQSPYQLGRQRRHHSDPGACVLKMQRSWLPTSGQHGFVVAAQHGSGSSSSPASTAIHSLPDATLQHACHSSKGSSKRERTSSGGDAAADSGNGSGGGSSSGASVSPQSFTISVDCRASSSTATVLWQRMHELEIRNKELEQQLVERMQAAQISQRSSSSSRQQHPRWSPAQQLDQGCRAAFPRAHAELAEPDSPVAMEVEPPCSSSAGQDSAPPQGAAAQSLQQQQQQQTADGLPPRPDEAVQQHMIHADDAGSPHWLVPALRQQVKHLQKELQRQKQLNAMLTSDNADLEAVLKETERQRREFAARYAFMTLDTDGDGYVSVEQVLTYDLFSCYAPSVLMAAFSVWRWDSGFPGYLCMDDFVRFVEYAEDRSTRESQRFWFTVMDADGDGRLSWADMKLLYDAVQRSCSGGILLHFEDLMNQVRDMVAKQRHPNRGFTAQELWESKLGAGVIGLLTNANNMLLQRSTAEWGRGDFPL